MATGSITIAGGLITPEQLDTIVQEVAGRIASTSKDPGQYEEVTSLTGISSIPTFQQLGNTYKLVRVAVSLLKGLDGKQIELQVAGGYVQWRYENGIWNNLIALADLKGEPGDTPEFGHNDTAIIWKYTSEAADAWKVLVEYTTLFNIDSLTPEQLDKLKLKFSDLTAADIQELQRPATEAATAAAAKVEELTTEVATAVANATSATTAANTAAENANTAAENVQDGKTPVFLPGTTTTVAPGTAASITPVRDGVDGDGNPIYKTNAELPQGEKGNPGKDFTILGYYSTLEALQTAVPNPDAGDAYGVGPSAPYSIYIWDGANSTWVDNGSLQGPAGASGKSARVNTERNVWQVFNDTTGQWEDTDYIVQYSVATADSAGLMSSADFSKLKGVQEGAEVNVQSDWNVTDPVSDAYIQNKPVLKPVATSGSYNDLTDKPSEIEAARLAEGLKNENFVGDMNNPTPVNGLLWSNDSALNTPPYKHGNIFQISCVNTPTFGDTWSWVNQLFFGTNGQIYHRNFTNTSKWGLWAKLAFSYEIPDLGNLTSNIVFSNIVGSTRGITGTVGGNDCWRVVGGSGGENEGYLEIATGDDGAEPIYVTQYMGNFAEVKRSATLLDAAGNTNFPGTVTSGGQALVRTDDARLSDARYPLSVSIGEGADLNNYTTPGFYSCQANVLVATLKNCPTTSAFSLRVEHTAYASCAQFLTTFDAGFALLYYRTIYWQNAELGYIYGGWQRIYTTYDKPPLATASANGLMAAADKAKMDRLRRYASTTTCNALNVDYEIHYVNLSANATLSVSASGTAYNGRTITAFVYCAAARTIAIPTTGSYISMCGSSYTCPAGKWVEFNLTCVNGIWHIAKLEQE